MSKFNDLFKIIMEDISDSQSNYNNALEIAKNEYYQTLTTLPEKVAFLSFIKTMDWQFLPHKEEYDSLVMNGISEVSKLENISESEIKAELDKIYLTEQEQDIERRKLRDKRYQLLKRRIETHSKMLIPANEREFEKLEKQYIISQPDNTRLNKPNEPTNLQVWLFHIWYQIENGTSSNNYTGFSKFLRNKTIEIMSNDVSDFNVCKNWGYQNGWTGEHKALFAVADKKHKQMMQDNPEAHKMTAVDTIRGDHRRECTCGFSYAWDSSD